MATEVTLSIPDFIFNQAQENANVTDKPVEDVLITALADLFPPTSVHPQREQMMKEVRAFEALHPTLVKTLLGQFVAIHNGQVVDHDDDLEEIIVRIGNVYPNQVVLIRDVQQTLPADIRMRPPRLIREP